MSQALVVDASVAVKWFVVEEDSPKAERLLATIEIIHAPTLLKSEIANALWKNWRRKNIDAEQAKMSLRNIGRVVGRWHEMDALLPQALDWSLAYDHPVYDLCYLALARAINVPLLTADERLLRTLAGTPESGHLLALRNVV